MARSIWSFAAVGLLAACGGEPARNAVAPEAGAGVQNQLAGLPEGQRNGVFIRAIRDAGQACQGVESSQRVGGAQGQEVWLATCVGGGRWTIQVADDGSASVTPVGDPATRQ
jgi:hypothetical protein